MPSSTSKNVFKCPFGDDACPGTTGNTSSMCDSKYRGPLCATCQKGYFRSNAGTECVSCTEANSWTGTIVLGVAVLFVVALTLSDATLQ